MKQYVINGRALNYWYNDRLYTITELLTEQSSMIFDSAMRLFLTKKRSGCL